MNTFRSRQAPVFSCSDGTEIKAGSDCRFIEITQNDKTYKVFASTMLACVVDNNDKDCPQISGRGVAGTDKPYMLIKAYEATCDKRSTIVPVFLSVFPSNGETIKELEDKINSFVCACCNGSGNDEDWTRVAGAAVYNITERIGIGTDSPDRQLDVVGDFRVGYANNAETGTYEIEFGEINVDSIAPAQVSEGYRLSVVDGGSGNGVEEFAIADDASLSVLGFWKKIIKTNTDGGDASTQKTHSITAEQDGLTLESLDAQGNGALVRLNPDGVISMQSVTNNGSDTLAVRADANGFTITLQPATSHRVRIENLEVYADNAAAIAGGLLVNEMYRTATGDLKIVF
jgi:hypothetical protein